MMDAPLVGGVCRQQPPWLPSRSDRWTHDNAAAESWNSTLESELLSRRHFTTKDQARREIAVFIDAYNHRRRHSSCEMMSLVAYEALLAERAAGEASQEKAA